MECRSCGVYYDELGCRENSVQCFAFFVFFFFFQAEDGIRDYKVTGVQTCALPICVFSKFHWCGWLAGMCNENKKFILSMKHFAIKQSVNR